MTIHTTSHGTATLNPVAAINAKPRAVEATRGISHMGYGYRWNARPVCPSRSSASGRVKARHMSRPGSHCTERKIIAEPVSAATDLRYSAIGAIKARHSSAL